MGSRQVKAALAFLIGALALGAAPAAAASPWQSVAAPVFMRADTRAEPAPGGAPLHDPAVDLAAVFMGFGIFMANAAFETAGYDLNEGEVVLECACHGGVVLFIVRDTGIGIAPQHLPIIFDMFRQADSSDARRYQGAGLGLYIVQRLVRQLGGEIHVSSEVGRGSTFTFTLSREGDATAAAEAPAPARAAS